VNAALTSNVATDLAEFDRGIDFSGMQLTSLAAPARQGAKFIMRYSAGAASAPTHPSHASVAWKLCGADELNQIVAAGYDFLANSEWTTGRITQGGAAGEEDGLADRKFWSHRGLARGASIYVSWDEAQPATDKHGKVAEYLLAYQDALDGKYHADLYAGDVAISAMLDRGVIRYGWRAMSDAWSGNGSFFQPGTNWKAVAQQVAQVSEAHLWQNGNAWFHGGADEDVILKLPIGSHLEALGGKLRELSKSSKSKRPIENLAAAKGVCTVVAGDTMSSIARRNGLSLAQLEQLNPNAGHPAGQFALIRPGDLLNV
jgi:LysM repeat protein